MNSTIHISVKDQTTGKTREWLLQSESKDPVSVEIRNTTLNPDAGTYIDINEYRSIQEAKQAGEGDDTYQGTIIIIKT